MTTETLTIEISHAGTAYETHSLIRTCADGRKMNVSYASTARGAKTCLSRYAKANGFAKSPDGLSATK